MENDISNVIKRFLRHYRENRFSEQDLIEKIKDLYFEDIGFAKIDHHRLLRRGFPEVVYGSNKTPEQIIEIHTPPKNPG
jgi:pyridinium-3,5-biscarboxylic acid mononucleotide synthase